MSHFKNNREPRRTRSFTEDMPPDTLRESPCSPWLLCILQVLVCGVLSATLNAQDRTPQQADALYKQVGDQLFCICGCRENLLTCSHNVCSTKEQERAFLRELAGDPKLDEAAIKQKMIERFGKEVLQVPEESSLYPVLLVCALLLAGTFGYGIWALTRRGATEAQQPAVADPEFDARIAKELKELE